MVHAELFASSQTHITWPKISPISLSAIDNRFKQHVDIMLITYNAPSNVSAGNSKRIGCGASLKLLKVWWEQISKNSSVCRKSDSGVQRPLTEDCTWYSATEITSN